jgi:hypothetical protein
VHGLGTLPSSGVDRLPRMAGFAPLGSSLRNGGLACRHIRPPDLVPSGTSAPDGGGQFGQPVRSHGVPSMAAIEGTIDADPVGALVREIMAERSSWTGSAADLLRSGASRSRLSRIK